MSTDLNLWETTLRDSAKRTRLPEGTVIFLGDSGAEKEKIVEKFCVSESTGSISRAKTEILSYDFFYAVDPADESPIDAESVTRVSMWSLSDQVFKGALEVALDPAKIERLVFMIALDFSKPDECCDRLRLWLHKTKRDIDSFLNKLEEESQTSIMESNLSYLKNISNENDETIIGNSFTNLGFPIIVVGSKPNFLQVEDAAGIKRAKEIQGELRCLCMQVGAALVFASSEKDQDVSRLQRYLLHRLYPEAITMPLQIQDGITEVFIPAGLDSRRLIPIATDIDTKLIPPINFNDNFNDSNDHTPQASEAATATTVSAKDPNNPLSELEDEQTWLSTLQSYIEQVVAGPVQSSKPTVSAASDIKSTASAEARKQQGGQGQGRPGSTRVTAPAGDHSNLPTEELKNFFENLLTNNNPPPAKR